jgi:hypothetical protein
MKCRGSSARLRAIGAATTPSAGTSYPTVPTRRPGRENASVIASVKDTDGNLDRTDRAQTKSCRPGKAFGGADGRRRSPAHGRLPLPWRPQLGGNLDPPNAFALLGAWEPVTRPDRTPPELSQALETFGLAGYAPGDTAPPFQGLTLDGRGMTLSKLKARDVLIT